MFAKERSRDMFRRLFPFLAFFLLALVLCAAEYLYSNRLMFATDGYTETVLDLSDAKLQGKAYRTQDGVCMYNGSYLIFENVDTETASVAIAATDKTFRILEFTVSMTDDAAKNDYRTYVDGLVYTDESGYFRIRSAGEVHTLCVAFCSSDSAVVTEVAVNRAPPVTFSFVRVIAVFLLILGLWLVWRFRLWKIVYDCTKRKHWMALTVILLVVIVAFALCWGDSGLMKYPYEETELNAYEQLFHSLLNGRLNIDIDCDTDLLASLENPYDYTERSAVMERFGAFWDRAYYDGNFYCYFGIAPVILFYFPIYWITGSVPNISLVVLLVSMIGAAALYGAVLKMIRYFRLRVPLLLLCIGYPVLVLCSLFPMIAVSADMYYLAVASGLAFIALAVFLAFSALCSSHFVMRRVLFALSGISLAATLASRPTVVLYAAVLVPPFLAVLLERGRTVRKKLYDALSFLLPLIVCVIPVLLYNVARFGSPFEFGASYQLTFHDISYNYITFDLLGETVMHYFLQPFQLTGLFPYFRPSALALDTYGNYFYSAASVGALAFPLAWLGAAQCTVTKKQPVKKAVYILLLVLPFAVAFADLCLGGVNIRYLTDIMLPLLLLGLLVLAELLGKANDRLADGMSYRVFCLCLVLLLVTAYLAFALIFANERNYIFKVSPAVYRFFATIFS